MKKTLTGIILLMSFMLSACGTAPTTTAPEQTTKVYATSTTVDAVSSATLARYRENEIRDYQGVRLDPAIGPADNSISGVQHVDLRNYRLTVDGLVGKPLDLSYDDVLNLTPVERLITLYCVTGWQATMLWRGVQLSELLDLASVDSEANTVIFHCADNYTTSMPLATIIDNKLIMAYQANGLPIPDEMGFPFIIVAEDKLGYKWARWVIRIELSADADYKGYWESRGFDNEADID
ncbi:MAG: molybdopterin-dependent oxidoreductase [Eubacteriales bacterium]|nr:molybdopterin-dependent oxidoreductase [Clostridiales bacterium]MDD4139466.1 molybdopterin-dependent oxidoreductase [Eubacteriales bacterium]